MTDETRNIDNPKRRSSSRPMRWEVLQNERDESFEYKILVSSLSILRNMPQKTETSLSLVLPFS